MSSGGLYIAEILCSPEVESKIRRKHGVTLEEVRGATIAVRRLPFSRVNVNGELRVLVRATTYSGRQLRIVLAIVDADDGTYELRTAF